MMCITELLDQLTYKMIVGSQDVTISGMTYDSREVKSGDLFFCLTGAKVDGHDYASQAVAQGAVVLVVERELSIRDVTQIIVADSRKAMGEMAGIFYGQPSQQLRVIGVTGTNGKTTTTHLVKAILEEAGCKVGLIGTIHALIGDRIVPVKNTTPDSLDLQKLFHQMVTENITHVVMEVSSHALAMGRVAGCEFDTAVFTNLTRDHLDYHLTFENYAEAKAILFAKLAENPAKRGLKTAIINMDDEYGAFMAKRSTGRVVGYGTTPDVALKAQDVAVTARGAAFSVTTPHGELSLQLKITGMFNVYNTLAAVGAALAEGVSLALIQTALEKFTSVAGRFELIEEGQPFAVVVDYAHTPDGLENILQTAKEFVKGRILVVFGCGGDRDRTKRPIMGALAARYADIVVVTSDNPRTEDPGRILQEVEVGVIDGGGSGHYLMIEDRKEAIKQAIEMAQPEDIVLIAGKGHETYQILKDRTIPFDDRAVAREVLKEMNR